MPKPNLDALDTLVSDYMTPLKAQITDTNEALIAQATQIDGNTPIRKRLLMIKNQALMLVQSMDGLDAQIARERSRA